VKKIILASTSPFRRELLGRLGVVFEALAPDYDEEAVETKNLIPEELAVTHALGKARSLAQAHPGTIVIGSDQVAEVNGDVLGKPGTVELAVAQLSKMRGRSVRFHTGVAVVGGTRELTGCAPFTAHLRNLTDEQINGYVRSEDVTGCAGSFKIEGLGIALMERLEGDDFTALIGLPLIMVTGMLGELGVDVLVG